MRLISRKSRMNIGSWLKPIYRYRGAYTLVELNKKHKLLLKRSTKAVLDLCASPGGWSEVAYMKPGIFIIAIDIKPIRIPPYPHHGTFLSASLDITTPHSRATVKRLMEENRCEAFDLVMHDGLVLDDDGIRCPGGAQNALVFASLKLAIEFLTPGGKFVTRIYRSGDYSSILNCLQQLFDKVEEEKLNATSAETYLVCLNYKAPAGIDPSQLDLNSLLQCGAEPSKAVFE